MKATATSTKREKSRPRAPRSCSILFCRIVAIGLTLALPACTDFKKDFLCRPDGDCRPPQLSCRSSRANTANPFSPLRPRDCPPAAAT
jgi:hypothetical protein